MTEEEKMLSAKTEDLFRLCEKYASPRFSAFLNEAQVAYVMEYAGDRLGYHTRISGGYPEAERCVFGVFPDWTESFDFPIAVLSFSKTYAKMLSHRDYLGTVLSLGIDRSKTGDILVHESGAYLFVMEDIADYIENNISKIANCGVKIESIPPEQIKLPQKEFEIVNGVAASTRLDAVLAGALNLSRRETALLINSGRTSVNHKPVEEISFALKEGDLLSIRGFGRMVLEEIGKNTRSGRIHILLKKYVR